MAIRYSDTLRNVIANAFGSDMAAAQVRIYTGTQPAAGAAATGTLLATITLPNPSFGAAATGVASKTGTWSGTVSASGTAGWFRMESTTSGTPNGRWVDGAIGAEMTLDNTALVSGGTVTVNTFTFTQPAQ